jgi:hypothetical protein
MAGAPSCQTLSVSPTRLFLEFFYMDEVEVGETLRVACRTRAFLGSVKTKHQGNNKPDTSTKSTFNC